MNAAENPGFSPAQSTNEQEDDITGSKATLPDWIAGFGMALNHTVWDNLNRAIHPNCFKTSRIQAKAIQPCRTNGKKQACRTAAVSQISGIIGR
jgi:hypothetical protein